MKDEVSCPLCTKHNKDTKLQLKQINFDAAVYLCPRKKCKYPKGYPWLVVQRTFEEFTKQLPEKKHEVKVKTERKHKDTLLHTVLKKKAHASDNTEAFNNILNDLQSITVEVGAKTELLDVQPTVTEETDNNELLNFTSTSSEDTNETCLQRPMNCQNDSLLNGSLCSDSIFSTSVNDVLEEFMESDGIANSLDFDIDELLI